MLTRTERLEKALKRARLRFTGRANRASPAFVFGAQRSGTDMVASVFNRCPAVECYYESDPEAFDDFVLRGIDTAQELTQRSRAKTVLFKSILNSQNALELLALHPDAKAIWMFRPFPDVVNSNLKRFRRHYLELKSMLYDPRSAGWRVVNVTPEDMSLVRKFYDKGVSDASARALLWFLRNQLFFQQRLETDQRVMVANYDHIVTNPVDSFRTVFGFFGLPFSPRYTSAVQSSSIGKDPVPEIDPEIAELCDRMFERLTEVSDL